MCVLVGVCGRHSALYRTNELIPTNTQRIEVRQRETYSPRFKRVLDIVSFLTGSVCMCVYAKFKHNCD